MKTRANIGFACLLLLMGLVRMSHGQDGTSAFTPIFDGRTLTGWHGNNPHTTAKAAGNARAEAVTKQQPEFLAHWRAEDGALINDGYGPYATTDQEYGDIELLVDYKTVAKADSGIYLRGTPQIQIWDTSQEGGKWDRNADKGSGGLFNNRKQTPGQLPLVLADRAFGEWNHFRILQIGSRTWVELNHRLVVDGAIMENYWDKDRLTPLAAKGPIHLQTHGGEIRWKNIAVREIGSDEAISRLRGDDSKYGFTSIFNGQDLSGWQGALDNYEVKDGALICKPGKGGVLFTEEQYEDFVVRLEFKLPPGGNNGLAIRYPGQGHVAYDAMCELQVLDDDAEKYAKLDPRQYHGSVYGVAPAHRGYLRPAGQWNYQEVTVEGSTIRVELNGTIILDVDVSQIHEYKEGRPHPGLGLKQGYFGFAGHNDPVMFRNIAIKQLATAKSESGEVKEKLTARELKEAAANSLIFHASFDGTTKANLSQGSGRLQRASSIARQELLKDRSQGDSSVVTIAQGQGRYGDALLFSKRTKEVVFYAGTEFGYQPQDWSGAVSLWLKLDPNEDLQPGFCDPLQVTQRGWNDGAFFVDFDKELPRDFRLGVFSDLSVWNPDNTNFDDIPNNQRPMIAVKQPPFNSQTWTHVCFTWQGVNASSGQDAQASLYLNGQPQGTLQAPLKFTWDPQQAAIMLGINYIGLMDDLMVFRNALNEEQVKLVYTHPAGGLK